MLLIATTGWGQQEDKQRALDAGFDLHLTKPVSPDELANLLAGADGSARTMKSRGRPHLARRPAAPAVHETGHETPGSADIRASPRRCSAPRDNAPKRSSPGASSKSAWFRFGTDPAKSVTAGVRSSRPCASWNFVEGRNLVVRQRVLWPPCRTVFAKGAGGRSRAPEGGHALVGHRTPRDARRARRHVGTIPIRRERSRNRPRRRRLRCREPCAPTAGHITRCHRDDSRPRAQKYLDVACAGGPSRRRSDSAVRSRGLPIRCPVLRRELEQAGASAGIAMSLRATGPAPTRYRRGCSRR
jgi:CheY-like chemotaxis protein